MRVLLFASLARSFGAGSVHLDEGPCTVGQALERLKAMGGREFEGELASVNILVNGRNIQFLDGLQTRVSQTDTVTLIPPVAGG